MREQKVLMFPATAEDRQPAEQPAPSRFRDGAAFGGFLRSHREAKGITLRQIAERTKILPSRLEGLERGDVTAWPAGIYRRAIVRDYATAVGLDPGDAVQEFLKLFPAPDPNMPPEPPANQPRAASGIQLLRCVLEIARLPRLRALSVPGLVRRLAVPHRRLAHTISAAALGALVGASASAMVFWSAMPARGGIAAGPDDRTASSPPEAVPPAAAVDATAALADNDDAAERSDVLLASHATTGAAAATEHRLRVTSNVPGARVTVNGIGWGTTPLTIRHLPPGPSRIRASKDGYRSVERTVQLTGARPEVLVRLELQPLEVR